MTATAIATWPTAEELHSVERSLADTSDAIEGMKMRLDQLVDIGAAPSQAHEATWASRSDLGTLTVFCGHVELELEQLRGYVEHFAKVRDAVALDLSIEEDEDA